MDNVVTEPYFAPKVFLAVSVLNCGRGLTDTPPRLPSRQRGGRRRRCRCRVCKIKAPFSARALGSPVKWRNPEAVPPGGPRLFLARPRESPAERHAGRGDRRRPHSGSAGSRRAGGLVSRKAACRPRAPRLTPRVSRAPRHFQAEDAA